MGSNRWYWCGIDLRVLLAGPQQLWSFSLSLIDRLQRIAQDLDLLRLHA